MRISNHAPIMAFLALLAATSVQPASAAAIPWSGAGADDNWSTPGNWSGGTPSGVDDVFFIDDDATGTSGPWGAANNIVDAASTIQSLSYRNTNGFHTTQIPSRITLSITGATATALFVGTGADNGGAQTVYATVNGGGTLFITNNSGVDKVSGLTRVNLGGTLRIVVNGALAGGEAFRLFEAGSYSGNFTAYDLPALPFPLGWDTASVPVDGTLRVTSAAQPAPTAASRSAEPARRVSHTGSWQRPT